MPVETIRWEGGADGHVRMIEQTLLPERVEMLEVRDVEAMFDAIRRLAVRGAPILNDALEEDARLAGLHEMVPIIGNGADVPGTGLTQCDDEFRTLFKSADLVISKGQGNFETLSEVDAPIFFLLKVKCPVVAEASGRPLNAHVLACNK